MKLNRIGSAISALLLAGSLFITPERAHAVSSDATSNRAPQLVIVVLLP